ncbi:MAG: VanZ family protein [bacterium]
MSGIRVRLMVSLMVVLTVAALIFFFSSQTGEDSSKLSGAVTRWLLERVIPGFTDMTQAQQRVYMRRLGLLVRKAAHFSEYALLALTLAIHLRYRALHWPPYRMALCAWGLSTLYAVTDELHQMFVSARGPAIMDVGIDSAGAIFGALVGMGLILAAIKRRSDNPSMLPEMN